MSTAMLDKVEAPVEASEAEPDEGFDHVVCHCDLTLGWCGAEVEVNIGTVELNGVDCPDCAAMALEYDERCPRGCDCLASERFWFCGLDDMNDYDEEEN